MDTQQKVTCIFGILMLAWLAGLSVYFGLAKKGRVRRRLPEIFLVSVLFWGVIYSLVWIPFTSPDEYAHFATAYRLSSRLLGEPAVNEQGMVLVRAGDAEELTIFLSGEAYETVYSRFAAGSESDEMIGYGHAAMEVANHAYLPQAIGISLARMLSLGQVAAIYLGRLCNLLFFLACGYLAIRLAPFGKTAFLGVSMLPMTLELASSLSYDGFAIGMGMLFTAYVLYLIYEAPAVGAGQLLILGVLLALLAPCKMVYIPLALLCFLIPTEKFGSKKKFWIGAAAVAVLMAAGILAVNLDKMLVYFQQTEEAVTWAEESAGYSISYVLAHPVRTIMVFVRTLLQKTPTWISTMLGSMLGWLEYRINAAVTVFLLLWVCLAGIAEDEDIRMIGSGNTGAAPQREPADGKGGPVMPLPHRIVSWSACGLTVLLTMFFMLLSWTPLTSEVVEGVQGRYFLPVLPLALLTLKNRKVQVTGLSEDMLLWGFGIANFFVIYGILAGI